MINFTTSITFSTQTGWILFRQLELVFPVTQSARCHAARCALKIIYYWYVVLVLFWFGFILKKKYNLGFSLVWLSNYKSH